MSNKKRRKKISRLSREILGLMGASTAISIFIYVMLEILAYAVMMSYCEKTGKYLSQIQDLTVQSWIKSISFAAAVFFFVVLFLFLLGQKLSYLREIIGGVEALRLHRMDYVMSLEGENELTELAESINYLAETERMLMHKEMKLREEKEFLLRALSHDIRTPLTAILSYSEYMMQKENSTREELIEFAELIQRKGQQIKNLTDCLLDGGRRIVERIEDGKLLMEQLTQEWYEMLEEDFTCEIDLQNCSDFSGEFDIQELRRIFDNLASNIKKYAAPDFPVKMIVTSDNKHVKIEQINTKKVLMEKVDSRNIGLASVRQIVQNYNGQVDISEMNDKFAIIISLFLQNSLELHAGIL